MPVGWSAVGWGGVRWGGVGWGGVGWGGVGWGGVGWGGVGWGGVGWGVCYAPNVCVIHASLIDFKDKCCMPHVAILRSRVPLRKPTTSQEGVSQPIKTCPSDSPRSEANMTRISGVHNQCPAYKLGDY